MFTLTDLADVWSAGQASFLFLNHTGQWIDEPDVLLAGPPKLGQTDASGPTA